MIRISEIEQIFKDFFREEEVKRNAHDKQFVFVNKFEL